MSCHFQHNKTKYYMMLLEYESGESVLWIYHFSLHDTRVDDLYQVYNDERYEEAVHHFKQLKLFYTAV